MQLTTALPAASAPVFGLWPRHLWVPLAVFTVSPVPGMVSCDGPMAGAATPTSAAVVSPVTTPAGDSFSLQLSGSNCPDSPINVRVPNAPEVRIPEQVACSLVDIIEKKEGDVDGRVSLKEFTHFRNNGIYELPEPRRQQVAALMDWMLTGKEQAVDWVSKLSADKQSTFSDYLDIFREGDAYNTAETQNGKVKDDGDLSNADMDWFVKNRLPHMTA